MIHTTYIDQKKNHSNQVFVELLADMFLKIVEHGYLSPKLINIINKK